MEKLSIVAFLCIFPQEIKFIQIMQHYHHI